MGRDNRTCLPGLNYHVYSRCINCENLMEGDYYKKLFLLIVKETRDKYGFKLVFYSILDNHFHLIIKTEKDGATISRIMQVIKSRFAREYNRMNLRTGPFWNERFGDKIVEYAKRPGEYMIFLKWYISYNACRKGYVNDPRDYRFCSIRYYIDEKCRDFPDVSYSEYFMMLGNTFLERKRVFVEYEDIYRLFL